MMIDVPQKGGSFSRMFFYLMSDSVKTEDYLLDDYIKKLLINNGKSALRCMHAYMSLVQ